MNEIDEASEGTAAEEWATWSARWKDDRPVPSADEFVALARRGRRRQFAAVGVEVLASAAILVFYGVLLARHPKAPTVILALANAVFVGVWLTMLFRNLAGTWTSLGHDARAHAHLLLAQAERRLRWFRFVERSLVAMAAFFLVWSPIQLATFRETYAAEPWRAIVGFGALAILLAGFGVGVRLRARRAAREVVTVRRWVDAEAESADSNGVAP
ncbi:MAG: hypothetical protein U0169_06050 [Polyangiaceae bacterium]